MAKEFFSREEIGILMAQVITSLKTLASGDKKKQHLEHALVIINANRAQFDAQCQTNIEWISSTIQSCLDTVARDPRNQGAIDTLYAMLFRCLVEFDLSNPNDLSMELRQFVQHGQDQRTEFIGEAQQQMAFAEHSMPIAVMKKLLGSEEITKLRDLRTYSKDIQAKLDSWESDLSSREKKVNELATNLERYEHAYNFVGLHEGFSELSRTKLRELWALRIIVVLLGMAALGPLAVETGVIYSHLADIDTFKLGLASSAIPMLSLTVILIYFFRLAVRSADAAKSQLLQIELRKTLCRFIQSYAGYVKQLKVDGGEPLSKFENVIFSGIVANEEKIPATFDGVDQLAKLVKAAKAG